MTDPKFLLVDIDDVVCDTAYAVAERLGVQCSRYERRHDRPGWLQHPDVADYVLFREFQVELPSYDLEMLPGVVEALAYARATGWDVFFVSARGWQLTRWTRQWLRDAGAFVAPDLVWCVGAQKQEVIRAHTRSTSNRVVLIDDWAPDRTWLAEDAHMEWVAFARPWNEDTRVEAAHTVTCWEQMAGVLDGGGE